MKAAVVREVGKPLTIEEVSISKPGPREVLTRNAATGVCHTDLHILEGSYPMPMWFAVDQDNVVYMTTFRRTQKIQNLKRDPRIALLVESGEVYSELKSVLIYAEVELIDDVDATRDTLKSIYNHQGIHRVTESMLKTASKRISMKFSPNRIISWDHSKLGGVY